MDQINRWPHRWFGIWNEYGPAYANCPSVRDFVCPSVAQSYAQRRLREYLTSAQEVASTSRQNFPSPFSGARRSGSISFRTDGTWLWLDDLPDYIEEHGVAIPAAFLAQIEANNFVPPKVDQEAIAKLEWPVLQQVAPARGAS